MPTRRTVLTFAATLPALAIASRATAAEPAVFQQDGLALGGTDAVAYFAQSAPVRGDPAHAAEWMGARWTFASAANRDTFLSAPGRYAPAFGGYCAWAASRGYLAPTVPEAWTIYEDRLYLNANLRIRRRWERRLPTIIAEGEANWPAILG